MQPYVQSQFVLEVHVHSYNNPTHGAKSPIEGEVVCCDQFAAPPRCTLPCDNLFVFCLGKTPHSTALNQNTCRLGFKRTQSFEDDDDLTFTPGEEFPGGVSNPIVFPIASWPVSVC